MPFAPPPRKLSLAPGEVHVFRLRLDLPPERRARLAATLSPDEEERARRLVRPELGQRFVAGRGQMREILGWLTGQPPQKVQFFYGPRGKPYLAGGQLQFNLSHSHDRSLLAACLRAEVGVDLERLRPEASLRLARRYFSPAEVAALEALETAEQPAAFFRLWTRKEAFIKARGQGLFLSLQRFAVSLEPGHAELLSAEDEPEAPRRWQLFDLDPGPGFAAALALPRGEWRLSFWDWPSEPEGTGL